MDVELGFVMHKPINKFILPVLFFFYPHFYRNIASSMGSIRQIRM